MVLSIASLKAFVLAGGAGTRLSPLTSYVPKGMIPIAGRPFIDYVVSYLSKHGIQNIMTLLPDEDSEVFRNHLEDDSKFGVSIGCSISPGQRTAAALKEAAQHVDGTFVVYYGDVLTDMDLADMIKFNKARNAVCTVALSTGVKIEYGVGEGDTEGRIKYFAEKPVLPRLPSFDRRLCLRTSISTVPVAWERLSQRCSSSTAREGCKVLWLCHQGTTLRHWIVQAT